MADQSLFDVKHTPHSTQVSVRSICLVLNPSITLVPPVSIDLYIVLESSIAVLSSCQHKEKEVLKTHSAWQTQSFYFNNYA